MIEYSNDNQKLSADFVLVCQGGPIEKQAALLIASLLENKKVQGEIIAAVPVGDRMLPLSDVMLNFLRNCNVRMIEINNVLDPTYPIAHKMMCCAIDHDSEYLIFMDSDMLLLSPITIDFLTDHQVDFAGRLTDFCDLTQEEWGQIYRFLDLTPSSFSYQAWASGESIPLSFNSGLMLIRDSSKIYDTWMKYARLLNDPTKFPKTRPFLDQISLVIAIQVLGLKFNLLSQKDHCSSPIFPIDLLNAPLFVHYYENIHLLGDKVLAPFCQQLIKKYDQLESILKDEPDLSLLLYN